MLCKQPYHYCFKCGENGKKKKDKDYILQCFQNANCEDKNLLHIMLD